MRPSFLFQFPLLVLSAVLLAGSVSVAHAKPDTNKPNFDIATLSNRADLISGGDALVEISVPHNVPLHQVRVLLNGVDVTAMFQTDATARTMRGVVTGLAVGTNTLIADSNGRGNGRPRASLTITNESPILISQGLSVRKSPVAANACLKNSTNLATS